MVSRIFEIDPEDGDLQVDFKTNLPIDVFRAFAIFKDEKPVHSQSSDLSNPVGQPDYEVSAAHASGGVLSCRFDCFGALTLVGQELKIDLILKQDSRAKRFSLIPITMKNYQGVVAQCRKDAWIRII